MHVKNAVHVGCVGGAPPRRKGPQQAQAPWYLVITTSLPPVAVWTVFAVMLGRCPVKLLGSPSWSLVSVLRASDEQLVSK
jgi:hypothetical protein